MYKDILPTRETVMRPLAPALLLCTVALPAAAQTHVTADQAARALQNPMVQEGVAAMVDQLANIVLDTQVGPLARYTDPSTDIRPNDTLRDVERRRDPQFEAKLHAGTRHAVAATGTVAGDAVAMGRSLQRTADRLQAVIAPLAGAVQGLRGPAPSDDGDN
jgi:hypothetical protein